MVLEEGNVKEILNLESERFYPQYWIALKPMYSAGFYFKSTKKTKREAYCDFLRSMLEKESFELAWT